MNLTDKIEKILKEKKVDYKFIPLPEDLAPDVPSHAVFHGIPMKQAMTTILYRTDKGIIAAVKRADTKVDTEKLKALAAVTQLQFASEDDLKELHVEVGMVPYLGLDIPFFIDAAVLEVGKAYGTAAEKKMGMAMDAKDIPIVNNGVVGDFAVGVPTESLEKYIETMNAIKKSGLPHEIIKHPPIKTVEEGLAYLGITADSGVSTLIFATDVGHVAVLRRDDHQLSEEKIKKELGAKSIRLCKPSEVIQLTHCEPGYVSPYNPTMTMLMDKTILEKDVVYLGTGSPEYDLKIAPKNLALFINAKPTDVVQEGVIRTKRRVVSGITPSGDGTLHIGNYLGAVAQFINIAKSFECFLFVADMHGLTTIQDKKHLSGNIEALILNELALLKGFLPKEVFERIVFYRQSDIAMHGELQSIINNVTPLGLLKRAHAYKDKLQKEVAEDDINLGLFNYPILMAADILLYHPDFVPVGKDQKQHVEITRDIAERFNKIYKQKVFTLPDPMIPEDVGAILGTDGKRKMSKSLGNIISIFESEAVVRKQVMGTYTDPTRKHATDKGHIEGNMVFTYLDFFGKKEKVEQMKKQYTEGSVGDVEVKEYLFESLLSYFAPARKAYEELKNNPNLVQDILTNGRDKALAIASKTMKEVHEATGLNIKYEVKLSKTLTIEEFAKVEVRVGKVVEARNKEGSEKLIRLVVDIGEREEGELGALGEIREMGSKKHETRVIFTGVRGFGYTPEDFANKQFFFITNLVYRKMLDEESQGMILAVDGLDNKPQFISAEEMVVGAKIR